MSDIDTIKQAIARLEELQRNSTKKPWYWHDYGRSGQTLAALGDRLGPDLIPGVPNLGHEYNVLKTTDDWPPTYADADLIQVLVNDTVIDFILLKLYTAANDLEDAELWANETTKQEIARTPVKLAKAILGEEEEA